MGRGAWVMGTESYHLRIVVERRHAFQMEHLEDVQRDQVEGRDQLLEGCWIGGSPAELVSV